LKVLRICQILQNIYLIFSTMATKNTETFVPFPLIVVDKPHGISSMTVVRILRRVLKPVKITKVGYAGTLDPYATGVLIVGVGREGTRQLGSLTDKDKEYVCEIDLLKNSYSGDMEDFKKEYQMEIPQGMEIPDIDQIKHLIDTQFCGKIQQVPPHLSAIKVNGQKSCDMVRKGIEIELKERTVTVYEQEILRYEFPVLGLRIKCSKGTYIRTLGQDIGKALGLWGTLVSLRRTMCGDHTIDDAHILDNITLSDLGTK
jgi:tRNA pseudouridine55 synthase